jgi:diaminohydroxyphosphoribosylaminopyrimidine deaminase/5-amino-6-(5-phosphoribosylamino)uracil reductase
MREALRLAARAKGRTAPNPVVGALLVRGGRALARGFHARAGAPHAEALALRRAGSLARGATLYVTLEPCAHQGRTPPCIDAVLAAGLARVVIGMRDPDPRTAGRSLLRLRQAGVPVSLGAEQEACRALNRGFVSRVVRGRPYTVLKLAASLDGRIATRSGESRWITGPRARAAVHRMRAETDAICIGSGTARADDPELSARRGGRVIHRPRRVLVDSRLVTPPSARLFADRERPTVVLTARDAPAARRRALERRAAQIVEVRRARGGRLDLERAWELLGALGVNDLLVEGGGGLGAALLRARLADRVELFLAPLLLGGDARPVLGPLEIARLAHAPRASAPRLRRLGDDLWIGVELRRLC